MRVVIAEDLALLRDGLIRLLTAHDIEIAAAVDNVPDLLDALLAHHPDVVVVDVRLPPTFTDDGVLAAITAKGDGKSCMRGPIPGYCRVVTVSQGNVTDREPLVPAGCRYGKPWQPH